MGEIIVADRCDTQLMRTQHIGVRRWLVGVGAVLCVGLVGGCSTSPDGPGSQTAESSVAAPSGSDAGPGSGSDGSGSGGSGSGSGTGGPSETSGPIELTNSVQFRPVLSETACGTASPTAAAGPAPEATLTAADFLGEQCYQLAASVLTATKLRGVDKTPGPPSPAVVITLSAADQASFATYTADNVGNKIAIVKSGLVITAPLIQGPISGRIQISGAYSSADIDNLYTLLTG